MADLVEVLASVPAALDTLLPYVSTFTAIVSVVVAWMVYRDQSSPDVVVHVAPATEGSAFVALYVENIGAAPAYDISFEVSGELPVSEQFRESNSMFLGHSISLLMPGARRGTYLGQGSELADAHRDSKALITVKFARRRGGKRISAEFPVDMLSFECALNHTPPAAQKLEIVANQSKRAANELNRMRRTLESMNETLNSD